MSFGRASLLLFCFLSVALCQQRKTTAKKSSRLHVPKCPRFWRISQLACLVSGRRATIDYLTQKRIRRGSFHNVKALIEAILDYIDNNNQNPHVFVWTAPVDKIMNKIAKCKEALDALH